ncbi:DUF6308 family protein [Streptomyces sp. NPDC087437]|uniref:DUF6308 family protein n=1 Tax=Streptomyces sp. NPDC087437 TaxID=3365789 RepID=UPI003821ABC5
MRRYFGIGLGLGVALYTGSRFEYLAGGGDRPVAAGRIMAEDLVAVRTLPVTVSASVVLDIPERRLGERRTGLPHSIPSGMGMDMVEDEVADLAPGSPAARSWHLLRDQPDVGWTIAGKLLARKRPRLLLIHLRPRCTLRRRSATVILARSARHAA